MSESHVCPQCSGSTFRSVDCGQNWIICECTDLSDPGEKEQQEAFKALHDALVTAGFEVALDHPGFCGQLLLVAQAAVKLSGNRS